MQQSFQPAQKDTLLSGGPATPLTSIDELTQLAILALTSADKEEREYAAYRLSFLSSYDCWERTKALLPTCTNNYLRFMICKAMLFIVSNEIGPPERTEMQRYVLSYLQERRLSGEELPIYVKNELFTIYASALYNNWKMAIMSSQSSEHLDGAETAGPIIATLQQYLSPEELLCCVLEIITYFAQQGSKLTITSIRSSFARNVLPYMFDVGANMLSLCPIKALEVCAAALECAPETAAPLLTVRVVSEPDITLARWELWANTLPNVVEYCENTLLQDPDGEQALLCARLLRDCSAVTCMQEEFFHVRDGLAERILMCAEHALLRFQQESSRTELLQLACALLTNTFERHNEAVLHYFSSRADALTAWGNTTKAVIDRFAEDEEELRIALMHLVYLMGERLLPRERSRHSGRMEHGYMRLEDVFDSSSLSPSGSGLPSPSEGPAYHLPLEETIPTVTTAGPLGSVEVTRMLQNMVVSIFMTYFNTVVNKAHMREDSQELRTDGGFVLHNEKTLLPLSQLLFCDRLNLVPILVDRLGKMIEHYQRCVRAREQYAVVAEGGAMAEAAKASLDELLLSLAVENMETMFNMDQSNLPLFLMHVCLSRLSVVISIFAIAMVNGTVRDQDAAIFNLIGEFAMSFLSEDDALTDTLLQCLSLVDGKDDSGLPSVKKGIHLGVLRSLFFFCGCVYDSEFSRRPEFYDIALRLLRFVFLYHSDETCLMVDANMLLLRTVTQGISGTSFLATDQLLAIIEAVKEDRIAALWFTPHTPLSRDQETAREGFLMAFAAMVETRYYAGYAVNDVVSDLVDRMLSDARLFADPQRTLQDFVAFTKGCHQPDTFQMTLLGIMKHKQTLMQVIRNAPTCAPTIIAWFGVVSVGAERLLDDNPVSVLQWELASFILQTLCLYYGFLSLPTEAGEGEQGHDGFRTPVGSRSPGLTNIGTPPAALMSGDANRVGEYAPSSSSGRFFRFARDTVDANVVYDTADILHSLCSASWCNLGILLYFERPTVERFFCGSVELLASVSPALLMSTEAGRNRVFRAILSALSLSGSTFDQLNLLYMRQRLWERLMQHLTLCLSYAYLPVLVQLLYLISQNNRIRRGAVPDYVSISSQALAAAFREVVVLLTVAPNLEVRDVVNCFGVLRECFQQAPQPCTLIMEQLLDYCSAYHRVRLRKVLRLLTDNTQHMVENYLSVFGPSSKVAVLSAW